MAAALRSILREPEVKIDGQASAANAQHLQAALEIQRLRMSEYAEATRKLRWLERAKRIPGVNFILRARHRLPLKKIKRLLQRFNPQR